MIVYVLKDLERDKGVKEALKSKDINGKAAAGCSRLYLA